MFLSFLRASTKPFPSKNNRIVIIGGGTAGTTFAAQALQKLKHIEVYIIDPARKHYYQPGWTLVGGGALSPQETVRDMITTMPKKAQWISEEAVDILPEQNIVKTKSGNEIEYDALIVAAGLEIQWEKIAGLKSALEDTASNVCSVYDYNYAQKTWKVIQRFKEGKAIFTQPITQIKCGGAPQKIMYLANDYWEKKKIRSLIPIEFSIPQNVIFGCEHYAIKLKQICFEKNIKVNYEKELVEVEHHHHIAKFKDLKTDKIIEEKYGFLHVVPPMYAPAIVRNNKNIADETGFCNVNKNTLQHVKYKNIFSIGDSSNLPTSKTAAAIATQVPVALHNVSMYFNGANTLTANYNGYTSCPITTQGAENQNGKVLLAEFDYDKKPQESFPWLANGDQRNPSRIFYYVKRYFFPKVYWNSFIKGTWYGKDLFKEPKF